MGKRWLAARLALTVVLAGSTFWLLRALLAVHPAASSMPSFSTFQPTISDDAFKIVVLLLLFWIAMKQR